MNRQMDIFEFIGHPPKLKIAPEQHSRKQRVLVACEESQRVCIEFRKLGHEAYSCDIEPCSGGHLEWHIQADVLPLLNGDCSFKTVDSIEHRIYGKWDMIIAFPPCTYITNAGAVRMRVKGEIVQERYQKAMEAKAFFMQIMNADCKKIAIENPTPMKLVGLPPYTQAIQPYEFGHPYSKRTCLWLKGLPKLEPTEILEHHEPYVNGGCKDAHGNYRKFQGRKERDPKTRAKTFPNIAKAMAEQWGKLDEPPEQQPDKTKFEQLFQKLNNPVCQCTNCLCQYCTHNVEELYYTIKPEEAAEEPCFNCNDCRIYSGDSRQKNQRKKECTDFIMSDYGAQRNRKRFKVVAGNKE